MVTYIIYAISGKIILYLLQQVFSSVFAGIKIDIIKKLFACDLCLGFWVYFILDFFFQANAIFSFYTPVVTEFALGAITTFTVHLVSLGWDAKFRELIVE